MDPKPATLFEPRPSLLPGVLMFVFRVPCDTVTQAMMPTPLVTTYAACKLPNKQRVNEGTWKDFIFVADQDGPPGYIEFLFVPPITEAARNVPVPVLSKTTSLRRPWDPCLLKLGAIEDATQPMTVELNGTRTDVPRLFPRHYLLPGGVYACRVDIEVYVSHDKFPDEMLADLVSPVPTDVSWNHQGREGRLQCLHGDVEFAETQTSGTVKEHWGTVDNRLVLGEKQVFPKTNMTKWVTHVYDIDHSDPINGMRRLTKWRVHPPPGARKILNAPA